MVQSGNMDAAYLSKIDYQAVNNSPDKPDPLSVITFKSTYFCRT